MTLIRNWDFYIIFNSLTNTYILLFGGSLDYCWATSSSLKHLGDLVVKTIKKYKSPENLQRTILGLSDYKYTPWNASMRTRRVEGDGEEYNDFLEECIEEGVYYVKNASKIEKEKRTLLQKKIQNAVKKNKVLHKKEKVEEVKPKILIPKPVGKKTVKVKLIKRINN